MYRRLVPRFYFNLCNGAEFVEDEEGIELADFTAARRTAIASLRSVMAGDLLMGDLNRASFIEIEDQRHELIETVSFGDVVRLREEPYVRRSSEQPKAAMARNSRIRPLD